jgi:hypothetical protein
MIVTHGKSRVLECATFDFGEKTGEFLMRGQSELPRFLPMPPILPKAMIFFAAAGFPLTKTAVTITVSAFSRKNICGEVCLIIWN